MQTIAISQLIHSLSHSLNEYHHDELLASQYAWWILEAITNQSKATLLQSEYLVLSPEQINRIDEWIHDHTIEHKPLAYLIGFVPFLDLTIFVEQPILIPRPETEEWCAYVIEKYRAYAEKPLRILDLCTGSGCIALAFAHAFPESHVYAVDISAKALVLAQKNALANNITNITFIESDLFTLVPFMTFDIILSNPPYISHEEWLTLDFSVKEWEDYHALVAANDGLHIISRIINHAKPFLSSNNTDLHYLYLEVGYNQAQIVAHMMKQSGYSSVETWYDSGQKERLVFGRITHATTNSHG